jgi:hypothetical protein
MTNYENVPTPWGRSTGGSPLMRGITLYHTPGHGGTKVVKKLNDRIPAGFRNEDGWYEEDVDSHIPFYFFHKEIEAFMTAEGMPGWSVSAEEYFGKYDEPYFRRRLEDSGYWIPACIYHLGTIYPPEKLDGYGRKKLAKALEGIRRKERRVWPKKGDEVLFDEEIRFRGGIEERLFIFCGRSLFLIPTGGYVRILRWKAREFETLR